ncbi:MAG: AEC family transporter [Clostridia bacterium]|nr:AEC family transporter [Clostridia bacterium]
MLTIFNQVFILFAFAAAGFIVAKSGKIKTEHTPLLSGLLVYVIAPLYVFETFSKNFTLKYISGNYEIILWSLGIVLFLGTVMAFMSKLFDKRKYERDVYEYSLVVPNSGYMGYPMAEAVLGSAGLLNTMIFCLPLSIYIYTIGYSKLTKSGLSFRKIFNPSMIAMLLGAFAGLFEIPIPSVAYSIMSKAGACMGPISMLLAGIVVSEFNFKELLSEKKIYIVTALRLFIIPVLIGIITAPFSKTVMEVAVLIYAMPCGLNTIVFPRLVDEDCRLGAGFALLSNILACLSIPIVLSLFSIGG